MPKFTETARKEIHQAEAHYRGGQADRGAETVAIVQVRTLVQLVEVLARIEKHLATNQGKVQATKPASRRKTTTKAS